MSEEAKVAARLMNVWVTDPFTCRVRLGTPQTCPFYRTNWCLAVRVKGFIRESAALQCPVKNKDGKDIAPAKCPLRFDKITVEGVEDKP